MIRAVNLAQNVDKSSSPAQLDLAIRIMEQTIRSTHPKYPDRIRMLLNMSCMLASRYDRLSRLADLVYGIHVADMALSIIPPNHPSHISLISTVGVLLGRRYERMGDLEDLNRAINLTGAAVDVTSNQSGHPHNRRSYFLNNYGAWLGRRFERLGRIDDLDKAIEVTSMSVEMTPDTNPERAGQLSNLGFWLGRRYERFGAREDLDWARVSEDAVKAAPPGHVDRPWTLHTYGGTLLVRFNRTHAGQDIDRAIELFSMVVEDTPPGHRALAGGLSMLAGCLGYRSRYMKERSVEDINRAVETASKAVEVTLPGDPEQARWIRVLSDLLCQRFEQIPSTPIEDFERAAQLAYEAMLLSPPGGLDRAMALNSLGTLLIKRLPYGTPIGDIDKIIPYFEEGWNCRDAPPGLRIHLARHTAFLLNHRSKWEESYTILSKAIELFPTLSSRSLRHLDKEFYLSNFSGLASMAAATAINAGKGASEALRLLELGRSVITSLLLEMRTDLSDLEQKHPRLAKEFISLRDELDSPFDMMPPPSFTRGGNSDGDRAKLRRDMDAHFQSIIADIRTQVDGFEKFLRAPSADELMAAADPDPVVVVNVSSFRCDAFLITPSEISLLPLPALTSEGIEERTHLLKAFEPDLKFLEWLWDVMAEPILEALGFMQKPSDDSWPHIWWVLTGKLCQIPVHAAGRDIGYSYDSVLDRVISSYSSSVKALIYGRQHNPGEPTSGKALLVSMPETPDQPYLSFAAEEMVKLEDLCLSLKLTPNKLSRRREDVLEQIHACKIFHFAGHGKSDPLEPSQSCLLLEDWQTNPLTVEDLRNRRLHENSPFLAYLSACHTSAVGVDNLVDEGIHLVSAFQLAGFRHAVGTLWGVSDEHSVEVMEILYQTLRDEGVTDKAVYRGVHKAIRALRERCIGRRVQERRGGNAPRFDSKEGEESTKTMTVQEYNSESNKRETDSQVVIQADSDEVATSGDGEEQRNLKEYSGVSNGTETDAASQEGKGGATVDRDERDPIRRRRVQQVGRLYWIPYVHFGV